MEALSEELAASAYDTDFSDVEGGGMLSISSELLRALLLIGPRDLDRERLDERGRLLLLLL